MYGAMEFHKFLVDLFLFEAMNGSKEMYLHASDCKVNGVSLFAKDEKISIVVQQLFITRPHQPSEIRYGSL
jgi:hypothetical protein